MVDRLCEGVLPQGSAPKRRDSQQVALRGSQLTLENASKTYVHDVLSATVLRQTGPIPSAPFYHKAFPAKALDMIVCECASLACETVLLTTILPVDRISPGP